MASKTLFLTDFDGTLTLKDFFHVVIDTLYPDDADERYAVWDAKTRTDFDYLSDLFAGMNLDEAGIEQLVSQVPIDPDAPAVIQRLQREGNDVAVISAGSDYYIHKLLTANGINNVHVYSNPGRYENHGIHIERYPDDRFSSELYGVDKQALAVHLADEYDRMIFVGDSKPDLTAAIAADVAFAKGALQPLLAQEDHPFIAIDGYADIGTYLDQQGES